MWLFFTSRWKSSSLNGPLGGNHNGWAVSWAWLSWLDHRCDNVCLRFLQSSQSMSLHHPHPPRGISLGQGAEMDSQAWSWRCWMESIIMHGGVWCSSMVCPLLQCRLCTGRGTLREKSLTKATSILGSLQKWATGPCGERGFSGAGLMMTLTRFGLGTDTLVHPLRRAMRLLCCSDTQGASGLQVWLHLRNSRHLFYFIFFYLICTSIIDASP